MHCPRSLLDTSIRFTLLVARSGFSTDWKRPVVRNSSRPSLLRKRPPAGWPYCLLPIYRWGAEGGGWAPAPGSTRWLANPRASSARFQDTYRGVGHLVVPPEEVVVEGTGLLGGPELLELDDQGIDLGPLLVGHVQAAIGICTVAA